MRRLKLVVSRADTRPVEAGQMIDQFEAHQRMRGFTDATVRRRQWTLTQFAEHVDIANATLGDVESFISSRRSPATRRALLADLHQFYVWAVKRQMLDVDPTAHAETVKVAEGQARPLSTGQLETAIAEARSTSLRVAVMLGGYAGLRVSEIASLRWEDIGSRITVREGKGRKDRKVPLARELADALTELDQRDDGHVIGTTGGNVSARIRRLFRRCGIDHRPHDLRSTFGTQVAERHDIVTASRMLGHASVRTTQVYLGWTPDEPDALDGLYGDAA